MAFELLGEVVTFLQLTGANVQGAHAQPLAGPDFTS